MRFPYRYPTNSSVLAPIITINVLDPLHMKTTEIRALVDTGYDGHLLLPYSNFTSLQLEAFQIDETIHVVGESVTGELFEMISAFGNVNIKGDTQEVESTIDTYVGNTECLIGRSFLSHFKVILEDEQVEFKRLK
ncbi:MAG: hypothetical protein INQ03_10485 [Candidatus Heimdallarchaeota archaeon]|nr:hypothetical protein [Candidatus Heimdallarchaeota archaeon]